MRSKNSVVALLLIGTLLIAPASLAAPNVTTGFGWLTSIKAFFADLVSVFQIEKPSPTFSVDDGPVFLEPTLKCEEEPGGELGPLADPSGCP